MSVTSGCSARPCTLVHCFASSSAFAGTTVGSALPCQIEIFGHGPLWREAPRTRSPHASARKALALEHAVERLLHALRRPVGEAGNDRAAREDLRIGRQHHGRHGAAGGKAGDEDAAAVEPRVGHGTLDHLADGERLALAAGNVAGQEPVEADVRVVGALLLGQEQGKAVALGERRPAGAVLIAVGRLRAAVQDDDERSAFRAALRHVGEHAQGARIGAEIRRFSEPGSCLRQAGGRRNRRIGGEKLFEIAAIAGELRRRLSEPGHPNSFAGPTRRRLTSTIRCKPKMGQRLLHRNKMLPDADGQLACRDEWNLRRVMAAMSAGL